ncbi:hypothetical protein SNE40_016991 [Patella caerulea]|uniref:Uncharacterized protein n=1 Tax=Patella caerulea TaxID=87958 RepID=A0AAN8J9K2_PATCE
MKTLQLVILACVVIAAQAEIIGHATCDNSMQFYADGVLYTHTNDNDWTKSSPIRIPDNTQVIAVKCLDLGVVGGIKLSLSNGIRTDRTWKCSATHQYGWETPQFDDRGWSYAVSSHFNWGSQPAALNGKADWIWTNIFWGRDTTVYCRKVIGRGISGHATCDNRMQFYADGVPYTHVNDNDWTKSSIIGIPDNTQVIAIKCLDYGVVGGIKLALSNGVKTDRTWKCSATYEYGWETPEFNDGYWPYAVLPDFDWGSQPAALNGRAQWIWTTGFWGQDTTVYCRKVIGYRQVAVAASHSHS